MKSVCITTREDVLTGMRLAGIDGAIVSGRDEALFALNAAKDDGQVALVLLCEEASALLTEEMAEMKLNSPKPLVLTVPAPEEKKR